MFFIDTFMFNGEWIAKLRLEYLYEYVDYFYIVESLYTHSGIKKDELFTEKYKAWFQPYISKVKFVIIDKRPFGNAWHEENFQRNIVSQYILNDMNDNEFILSICDCDEIYDISSLPSKEELARLLKSGTIIYFTMDLYMFSFIYRKNIQWSCAFMIHSSLIDDDTNFSKIRTDRIINNIMEIRSCWHFSYFFNTEGIARKLRSFAHTDLNTAEINNKDNIQKAISQGGDLFNGTKLMIEPTAFELQKFPPLFKKYYEELLCIQTV